MPSCCQVILPASAYLVYIIYARRYSERKENRAAATMSPNADIEKHTLESQQPSTTKLSLSIPKWIPQGGSMRRGSDGGFPPGTRHITFPDPTIATPVDSFDHKMPPSPASSVLSPVALRHPTPPPHVHI
jgi:hypothetical protein